MQSVVASLVPLSEVSSGVVRQEIAGQNTLIGKNANRDSYVHCWEYHAHAAIFVLSFKIMHTLTKGVRGLMSE